MLLSEISQPPDTQPMFDPALTFDQNIDQIAERQGAQVYRGSNARVLVRSSSNFVLRIWVRDGGFERWLTYVNQHSGNPHLVKTLSSHPRKMPIQCKGLPRGSMVSMLKMEKLNPLRANSFTEIAVSTICQHMTDYTPETAGRLSLDIVAGWFSKPEYKDFVLKNKRFVETLIDICKFGANDINDENIMQRADKTLVIVDPISE